MQRPRASVRAARGLVLVVALAAMGLVALASCSVLTTWDGLTGENADAATAYPDSGGADHAIPDTGPATPDASGGEAGPGSDGGPSCVVGAHYCGGNGVVGDPTMLYTCTGGDRGDVALACSRGCVRRLGGNDSCVCTKGGRYCGNDQVLGDPNILYTCNGDLPPTVFQHCPSSCVVNVGVDDTCK